MHKYTWEILLSRFNECLRGFNMFGYISDYDAARFDKYSEHITMFDTLDLRNYTGILGCLPEQPQGAALGGLAWHSNQH